jgi:hypothetical protein
VEATVGTIGAAREHGETETRSRLETDLLHTRVEGALNRGNPEDLPPEIRRVLQLIGEARGAIRPGERTASGFIARRWRLMAMTVDAYGNPLDRARTWHTAEIERLTLVMSYELRCVLAALPALVPEFALGVNPSNTSGAALVSWAPYMCVAAGTAIAAPWVAARAMDPSASRFRGRLAAMEVTAGSLALIGAPSWPIVGGVLSAILNVWNREGGFGWRSKVPAASTGAVAALALGTIRAGLSAREAALAVLGGGIALALISSIYGVWWPFSGASLIGTAIVERRGIARARALAREWLPRIDAELAEAERALDRRGDADGLFRVRLARSRLTADESGGAETIGEILASAMRESVPISPLTGIRIDASEVQSARVVRDDQRRNLTEAMKLLIGEAITHGVGVLDVQVTRSGPRIEVLATNPVGPRSGAEHGVRPGPAPRGRERLAEFADSLDGAAFEPVQRDGRYATGFWFSIARR